MKKKSVPAFVIWHWDWHLFFTSSLIASYILWTSIAYSFHVIREQNEGCKETRWYQLQTYIITWIWLLVSQMPTEGLLLHSWDPRIDHSWPCADAHSFRGILVRNYSRQIVVSGQDKDSSLLSGFCNRSLNTASHFSSDFISLVPSSCRPKKVYIYMYIYNKKPWQLIHAVLDAIQLI